MIDENIDCNCKHIKFDEKNDEWIDDTDYNRGWNEALEAVFNLLNKKYFSGEQPVLAILEDKDSRPAMPDIFELINTLKK